MITSSFFSQKSKPGEARKLILLSILVILGYLPALTAQFGVNVDYHLLPGTLQDRQPFIEFSFIYMVGREAWAFLLNWQSWLINEIWHLVVARWIGVALLLVFLFFLKKFLCLAGFQNKAIYWILPCIAFLPQTHALIIYAVYITSGIPALLTALGSYYCLERGSLASHLIKRTGWVSLSVAMFLGAIFTYQASAMFVFVCTAVFLLKDFLDGKDMAWQRIQRDCFFYFLLMAVYLFLHTQLFLEMMPPGTNPTHFSPIGGRYEFAFNLNIMSKIVLLQEIQSVSLGGILYSVISNWAAFIGLAVLVLGHIILWNMSKSKRVPGVHSLKRELIFLSVMAFLFTLCNFPALIAKSCFHVTGFRMVYSSTVMILLWQALLWTHLYSHFKEKLTRTAVRLAGGCVLVLNFVISYFMLTASAEGYRKELNYVSDQLDQVNWKETDSILFIPPDEGEPNFANQNLLYEYRLPARYGALISYLAMKKKYPLVRTIRARGPIVFADPYSMIMNIKTAVDPQKRADTSVIKISAFGGEPAERVLISWTGEENFILSQFNDKGKIVPFWRIKLGQPQKVGIELDLERSPKALDKVSLGAVDFHTGSFVPIGCLVAGSVDGVLWQKLGSAQIPVEKEPTACLLENNRSFRKYQLYMTPNQGLTAVDLSSIRAIFDWK